MRNRNIQISIQWFSQAERKRRLKGLNEQGDHGTKRRETIRFCLCYRSVQPICVKEQSACVGIGLFSVGILVMVQVLES